LFSALFWERKEDREKPLLKFLIIKSLDNISIKIKINKFLTVTRQYLHWCSLGLGRGGRLLT
jgi:hypothetical protein